MSPGNRQKLSNNQPYRAKPRDIPIKPTRQSSTSRPPAAERIPINTPPQSKATPPPPKSPRRYSPEEVSAAEKIQTFWRTHHHRRRALAVIAELGQKFEQLKSDFMLPPTLDYMYKDQVVSVPTTGVPDIAAQDGDIERTSDDAKLAYTAKNAPVHMYVEELSRILTKLDSVESGGDKLVRDKRRELARRVEMEAERVEKLKVLIWRSWVAKQNSAKQDQTAAPSGNAARGAEAPSSQPVLADPSLQPDITPEPQQPDHMQVDGPASDSTSASLSDPSDISECSPASNPPSSIPDSVEISPGTQQDPDTLDTRCTPAESPAAPALPSSSQNISEDTRDTAEDMQVDTEPTATCPAAPADTDAPIPATVESTCDEEEPIIVEETNVKDEDVVLDAGDSQMSTSDAEAVPIIIEEPDPDDPGTQETSEVADVDLEVEPEPDVVVEEFVHPALSASVLPSRPVADAPAPEPLSSPPALAHSVSETEDSDEPPLTPPVLPVSDSGTVWEKPHALDESQSVVHKVTRPVLVSQNWDEQDDFF